MPRVVANLQGIPDPLPYLHFVGSLGPALAALFVCVLVAPSHLKTLQKNLMHLKVGWTGWLLALSPLLLMVMALPFTPMTLWGNFLKVQEYPHLPFAALVLCEVLFYGFGEEVGWRGFLYPLLKERFSGLKASLMVLPFWAVWHLPLILTNSTYQSMGPMLLGWLFSLTCGALLTAWLYEKTRGSLPVLAVFHGLLDIAMVNLGVGPLMLNVMGAITTLAGIWAGIDLWKQGRQKPSKR